VTGHYTRESGLLSYNECRLLTLKGVSHAICHARGATAMTMLGWWAGLWAARAAVGCDVREAYAWRTKQARLGTVNILTRSLNTQYMPVPQQCSTTLHADTSHTPGSHIRPCLSSISLSADCGLSHQPLHPWSIQRKGKKRS